MDNAAARELIEQQQELLKRLTASAVSYGAVVAVEAGHMAVAADGKLFRCNKHPDARVGSTVVVIGETGQILEVAKLAAFGSVATLVRSVDGQRVEVDLGGALSIKALGSHLDAKAVKAGARVVLDASDRVVLEILPEEHKFHAATTTVQWDHIGGNELAKQELREALAIIKGGTDVHKAFNVKAPKGLLLYGPPGCGKTMLGKAAATELSGAAGAFLYVKATELLSKYVGVAEANIRNLFQSARTRYEATGQAVVIFVDEADAILQKRGSGVSSDTEKTIVPTFLTEMDGLEDSAAFVILATNRPDTLDPAVIREGRVDRRINVERPAQPHGHAIFGLNLAGVPLGSGLSAEQLAQAGAEAMYRVGSPLANEVSGALITGAVERAKRRAIRRAAVDGGAAPGLLVEDVVLAVTEMEQEY